MNVADNYDAYTMHEAEQEKWLAKRPICVCCKEPIQEDELYDLDGKLYCETCMNESFKRWSEDYER